MSLSVPGPNRASQRRMTSTCASLTVMAGIGRPSHRSIGAQRYWLLTQLPRGRARTAFPSTASSSNTRLDMAISPSYFLPQLSRTFRRRAGTSAASSWAVASPRFSSAASAAFSVFLSQAAGLLTPSMAASDTARLRSARATPVAAAAWKIATSSEGTTNMVRRIASIRSSSRSS